MTNDAKDRAIEPTLPTRIHSSALNSTGAVAALGLVAATALQKVGLISLMVGTDGYIEVVPPGELELDRLLEPDVLRYLVELGYTDAQLSEYLRQRAVRVQIRAQPSPQDDHR